MTENKSSYNPIYDYPKSSCFCEDCVTKKYPLETGVSTNFGVHNCDVNGEYYKCFNYKPFKIQIEPRDVPTTKGTLIDPCMKDVKNIVNAFSPSYIINNLEVSNFNPDFYPIQCDNGNPSIPSVPGDEEKLTCPNKDKKVNYQNLTWVSTDPRLLDPVRNSLLHLDRPPFRSTDFQRKNPQEKVDMMEIYDEKYENYGKCYKTYSDIKAGDIYYYVDKSREDAYYEPNFTIPARTQGVMFKDPMGTMKPTYQRYVTKFPDDKYSSLSSIRDINWHREDIMSAQMAVRNQQRYEPRYTNNYQ